MSAKEQLVEAIAGGFTTSIKASGSESTLHVLYQTLPGNQPNTYGNFFTWWQNLNDVPWAQGIINDKIAPPTNSQGSSHSVADVYLGTEAYLVAWAVGKELGNIVATSYLPAVGTTPPPNSNFSPTLVVEYVGSNSAVVNYGMPAGSNPSRYKHWVALWEGAAASYGSKPSFLGHAPVFDSAAKGAVAINGVPFRRARTYTVAYFAGGYDATNPDQTTMAVTHTFST